MGWRCVPRKTDANGILVWSTAFGTAGKFDFGYSVRQTSDGGYIIAGLTNSTGAGLRDVLLIKTNSTGVLQWSKTYGGASDDEARSVEETADGGFIISGFTQSYGSGYQMYLIKTNSTGTVTWSKTFGGGGMELGYSVKQTSDGGYVLLGYSDSYGSGLVDVLLLKLTATGGISWSKTYGGASDDYGLCINITTDGGYIISGKTLSYGGGAGDFYLIKTDVNGVHQWSKAYGGTALDQAGNVQQTADGGYILTGYTMSFGAGIREAYLVKTDATGASGCSEFSTTTQTTSATVANSTGATEGLGLSAVSPVTATRRVMPIVTTLCSSSACSLVIASFTQTNVSCNGGANGTATITTTGGVGAITYNWTPGNPTGDGTASVTGLTAGTWTCTITDANSCTANDIINITAPLAISNSQSMTLCYGQSAVIGTNTYSISGIYTDVLSSVNGCDSTVTTNLTIYPPINITTLVSGSSISSNASPANYQWIDCNNSNLAITGEINQMFVSSTNGSYAVIVSQNGCTDTSACVNITTTAMIEANLNETIRMYPNPTSSVIKIEGIPENSHISIINSIGQKMLSMDTGNQNYQILDLTNLASGIYSLQVETKNNRAIKKIVKN